MGKYARKCPNCSRRFKDYKAFQEHWWKVHHTSKAKKKREEKGAWKRPSKKLLKK